MPSLYYNSFNIINNDIIIHTALILQHPMDTPNVTPTALRSARRLVSLHLPMRCADRPPV